MKQLDLSQGRISYREEGSGQPVVFLHGTLTNGNTWRKVIGPLSQHVRCIVPDLPLGAHQTGFAQESDLSPRGIAAILDEFLTRLGVSDIVLVGNDTGGAYAQGYTMLYPQKVARLVLINSDAFEVFPPKHFASLQMGVRIPGYLAAMAALFRIKPFLKSSMVLGLLSHRLTKDEIYQLYSRHFIENSAVRADFRKVVRGWSPKFTQQAAEALRHFDKPVLVMWGEDDQVLFPRELGERLARVFLQARFELVRHSLTFVQEDQPEEFVHRLLAFLRATEAGSTNPLRATLV